jgi:hypothetical protein
MSSDCTRQIREKERWLAGTLPKGGDAERELSSLLATAALVRGAVEAIPVPARAEEASRDACTALLQEQWKNRRTPDDRPRPWPALFGSWLRVVFTLWRRR